VQQQSSTVVGLEVAMGTILELSSAGFLVRTRGSTRTVVARTGPATAVPQTTWLTATIRPAGTFGRNETSRLRALLDALSACASIVVLDLEVAQLRSPGAGEVIENAAGTSRVAGAPRPNSMPPGIAQAAANAVRVGTSQP
jgi:hypothetical protein